MDKERLFRYLDRKYSSKSEIIPNIPLGENADVIWAEILQNRRERGIELPLRNLNGDTYWYILTNKMISASEVIVDELMEQENTAELHKSPVATIEEIFYTGFMEGAQISIQDAMEFLQSGEEPESVEELILMNSRQAAGFAAENMYHAIDSNYLHNLAYFLTDGLDNGGGDYRITDTVEIPSLQGEVVQLPPAAMIPEQTERFAEFLADTATHPLIKAAAAQAWVLAYRPFPEGNERLSRLLSNVILIRAGYTFFGNISISSILARTSYEYFRAIANILRTENGADLTYFLEYYLVALSSAVNDMRARREHKAETVVEAEQKLAAVPLQSPQDAIAEDKVLKNKGNPLILNKHRENEEKIGAALDRLRQLGYEQFTLHDLEAITGINRKQISKLLVPYEEAERIIAVRKSKVDNIYAFRQASPPEDEKPGTFTEDPRIEIESVLKKNAISAIKKRIKVGTKNAAIVARALLKQIDAGVFRFSTEDIVRDLDISTVAVRNSLQYYLNNDIIRVINNKKPFYRYEFSFLIERTDDNEENAGIITQESLQEETSISNSGSDTMCSQTAVDILKNIHDNSEGTVTGNFAGLILSYIHNGINSFSATEISRDLGIHRKSVNNFIRKFAEKGIIYMSRKMGNLKYFSVSSNNLENDIYQICGAYPKLIKYAKGTGNPRNQIARILISYIRYGKLTVTSEAIAKKTGMNYKQLHNALRPFFRMGLLSHSAYSADGQKCYLINVGGESQFHCGSASEAQYSTDVLNIIRSLINSEHAPKDNRIGKIIYSCLEKGTVTVDDYRKYGAEKKINGDMRFAEKLGIVKKKSTDSYEIMHDLSEHEIVLEDSLKNTLTMLYDIFGEDAFSIEMVAAKLDYSESHMSATLHQLAWLKILDSSDKDGRKRCYQLLVNPTDNPELFKAEAA